MRTSSSILTFFCGIVFATSAFAHGQSKGDWKKTLEEGLQTAYKMAKASRWDRNNVTEPGTIFVMQKEGLVAGPADDVGIPEASVKDGVPKQKGGLGGLLRKTTTRTLNKGERVYLIGIDVQDDLVKMTMLTCDMSAVQAEGSTKQTRYRGAALFEFGKPTLSAMDLETAKKAIEVVLLPEDKATATSTKTIALGMTMVEVEAILGKPENIINLGSKVTYVYKNMKIIFVDGKVADVQ